MDHQFWHSKWESKRLGFHQEKVNSRLRKFWPRLALPATSYAFVPLCGKSLDMCWLAERHPVLGVELSDIALRDFFSDIERVPKIVDSATFRRYRGGPFELLCGDFFALTSADLGQVGGVYDRASLVALPAPLRARYARHLGQVLPSGCQLLLITMIYDERKMHGPPFSVTEDEIGTLFAPHFAIEKVAESEGPDIVGNLRDRGLDTLIEQVFILTRNHTRPRL